MSIIFNVIDYVCIVVFGIISIINITLIGSALFNIAQKHDLSNLSGILGKIINILRFAPEVSNYPGLTLLINFLLFIFNWVYIIEFGSMSLTIYTVLAILIGGAYFHLHFVRGMNRQVDWFAKQTGFHAENVDDSSVTKEFYKTILIDNTFNLIIINLPIIVQCLPGN